MLNVTISGVSSLSKLTWWVPLYAADSAEPGSAVPKSRSKESKSSLMMRHAPAMVRLSTASHRYAKWVVLSTI